MTTTRRMLTITVPIPPYPLSKNGRLSPWERNRLYQQHKMVARNEINRQVGAHHMTYRGPVTIQAIWYAARRPFPDFANAVNRLEAYVDAAEETGIIANDNQITDTTVRFDVDTDNPRVELTFVLTREATP